LLECPIGTIRELVDIVKRTFRCVRHDGPAEMDFLVRFKFRGRLWDQKIVVRERESVSKSLMLYDIENRPDIEGSDDRKGQRHPSHIITGKVTVNVRLEHDSEANERSAVYYAKDFHIHPIACYSTSLIVSFSTMRSTSNACNSNPNADLKTEEEFRKQQLELKPEKHIPKEVEPLGLARKVKLSVNLGYTQGKDAVFDSRHVLRSAMISVLQSMRQQQLRVALTRAWMGEADYDRLIIFHSPIFLVGHILGDSTDLRKLVSRFRPDKEDLTLALCAEHALSSSHNARILESLRPNKENPTTTERFG